MGKKKSSKSVGVPCLVNQHDHLVSKSGAPSGKSKKLSAGSKKKKFVRKEKNLVKGKVTDVGNADVRHAKNAPAQVDKLLKQVDSGVSSPANYLSVFQPAAFSLVVQPWIECLARYTPIFVGTDPQTTISPLEAWLYAFTVAYAVIKKHGRLSAPSSNFLDLDEDFTVEQTLGKLVQYLMTFVDGEVTFKMTASPDFNVTISTGTLDSSIASYPVFGALTPYADGNYERYNTLVPLVNAGLGQGTLVAGGDPPIGSYLTWMQQRFPTVSNVFSQTKGMKVVRLVDIMPNAPDCSAYSTRTTALGTQYVNNYSVHHNKEFAYILSYNNFDVSPIAALSSAPIVANQFRLTIPFALNESYLARCIVWLGFNQEKWGNGPIDAWQLHGQKLTSFNFRSQPVTGDSFNSHWQRMYTAIRAQNELFTDSANTFGGALSGLMLFNWVMNILYHRCCDIASPIALTKISRNNPSLYAMQQFYNPGLPGVGIPPPLQRLISGVGPIVVNGEVVFPLLSVKLYSTATTNTGTLMAMSTINWNPATNNNLTFPFSANETIASPNIKLNNVIIDSAWQTNYTTVSNTTGFGCVFPNTFYPELVDCLSEITKTYGGIQQNLSISKDSKLGFGRCSVVGTIGIGALTSVVSSPASTTVTISYIAVDKIRSTCSLTAEETLDAACYCAASYTTSFGQRGPYSSALPRFSNAQAVLNSGYAKSFSPNTVDPGSDNPTAGCVRVDGMVVNRIPAQNEETAEKLFDQFFSATANNMLGGLRSAVCSGVAMGVGQIPILGSLAAPVSKSLCDAGLPKLFNFVAHRASLTSDESSAPKPIENCFNSKGLRIAAFQKSLPCMLKATGMQQAASVIAPSAWKALEAWKKAAPRS